jgi:type IV secretory pathway VirJ component
LTFGAAGTVHVYVPATAPDSVALFVSGDGGWNQGVVDMAERLRGLGALVVGIDIRTLYRNLAASPTSCAYPAGDLEELSRHIQMRYKLPKYRRPVLVGYSSGATLVFALLASAPPETFAGALSLGFCPDIEIGKALCPGRALMATRRTRPPAGFDLSPMKDLGVPWHVLHGDIDQVCSPATARAFVSGIPGASLHALPKVGHGFSVPRNWDPAFVEAWRALTAPRPAPLPLTAVAGAPAPDLPLVEVQAAGGGIQDLLAVVVSGDGGWAGIDKAMASAFAARGVPTVGWNSLDYFWTPRTPEGGARDLDALLRHYLAAWGKRRAILVGYSFGADVLPFLTSRLSADVKTRIASVGLIGLGSHAAFEFHVSSWLGGGDDQRFPTGPEVRRLAGIPVVCIQGSDESDSGCKGLAGAARVETVQGGHHYGGDYVGLAARVLQDVEGERK